MDKDLIQKAKAAKSADELLVMAKENGIEMSADEAIEKYKALHPASGELDDDELDNVSGGACVTVTAATCPKCGSENVSMAGTQDYPLITCHACGYNNNSSIV